MLKTLGKWLSPLTFFMLLALAIIKAIINITLTTLLFIGSLTLGYQEGFSTGLIILSLIFGSLLTAELTTTLTNPRKFLQSIWPNLFVASLRLVYLSFAGLLFYGLFWDNGLEKHFWIYLVVAILLTILNLPWMVFHLALCAPKLRNHLIEFDTRIRCTCPKECDCQKPHPDCPVHNPAD